MDETAVRDRARSYFDGVSPCHDFQHVRRVVATAKRLADAVEAGEHGPARDVDRDVLVAAGWLHDVGRGREDRGEIDDHATWGAREARDVLRDLGVDDDAVLDAVDHCIRAHRFSNDVAPETLEAELLSDADNLDATGAVGGGEPTEQEEIQFAFVCLGLGGGTGCGIAPSIVDAIHDYTNGRADVVVLDVDLDGAEIRRALDDEDLRERIHEQFGEAHQRGVTGVPTFVHDQHAARGAVPPEQLARLVEGPSAD